MITIAGDPWLIAFLGLTWVAGLFALTWIAAPYLLRWLARKTTPPLRPWDDDRSESMRAMVRGFQMSWPHVERYIEWCEDVDRRERP